MIVAANSDSPGIVISSDTRVLFIVHPTHRMQLILYYIFKFVYCPSLKQLFYAIIEEMFQKTHRAHADIDCHSPDNARGIQCSGSDDRPLLSLAPHCILPERSACPKFFYTRCQDTADRQSKSRRRYSGDIDIVVVSDTPGYHHCAQLAGL